MRAPLFAIAVAVGSLPATGQESFVDRPIWVSHSSIACRFLNVTTCDFDSARGYTCRDAKVEHYATVSFADGYIEKGRGADAPRSDISDRTWEKPTRGNAIETGTVSALVAMTFPSGAVTMAGGGRWTFYLSGKTDRGVPLYTVFDQSSHAQMAFTRYGRCAPGKWVGVTAVPE